MRADAPCFIPQHSYSPKNGEEANRKKVQEFDGHVQLKNGHETKIVPCRKPKSRSDKRRRKKGHSKWQGGPHRSDNNGNTARSIENNKQKKNHRRRRQKKRKGPSDVTKGGKDDDINVQGSKDDIDFPSLTKLELKTKRNLEKVSPIETTGQWSAVANVGHAKSESRRLEYLRECERKKKEIETYTRMDILGPRKENKQADGVTYDLKNISMIKDQSRVDVEENVGVSCYPGKLLNLEKLRQRWSKALEEKRIAIEEKRKTQIQREEEKEAKDDAEKLKNIVYSEYHWYGQVENRDESFDDDQDYSDGETCAKYKYVEMKFPLHIAIMKNDEDAVRDLVVLSPEMTCRDERVAFADLREHTTLSHSLNIPASQVKTRLSIVQLAILLRRPNILKILLSSASGSSLKYVTSTFALDDLDEHKRTPLMIACEFGLDESVKVILSHSPKLAMKHQKSGDSALHIACRNGNASTVDIFFSSLRGKDGKSSSRQRLICARNRKGETSIHSACIAGKIDTLEVLLRNCSSADKVLSIKDCSGKTPLVTAISQGALDVVMHLLTWRGNQREHVQTSKDCPLILAVKTRNLEMVQVLLDCRSLSVFQTFDYTGALYNAICSCDESDTTLYSLLVEEGADPHTKMRSTQDLGISGDIFEINSLTLAALKGNFKIVACMLDAYSSQQLKRMKFMRTDRNLRAQPASYFTAVESKEKEKIKQSLNNSLVKVLQSAMDDCDLSSDMLRCCLVMFRKGAALDDKAFVRLFRSLQSARTDEYLANSITPDEVVYQARYRHPILDTKIETPSDFLSPYIRPLTQYWSQELVELDWIWENQCLIHCPWIEETLGAKKATDKQVRAQHDDSIFVIVSDKRFLVHKSILSKMSGKVEAAIRFEEMKIDNFDSIEDSPPKISIQLDIPVQFLSFLVMHCYHGSIVAGLSSNLTECCQQLLDLYALSQEFLCPSLALECEMRLLSKNPYKCFCWHCCDEVDSTFCFYNVKGPPKLLTPNNYLGIISNMEFDVWPRNYTVTRKGSAGFVDAQLQPLSALKAVLWKSVLLDFQQVMKTDSFLTLFHSTIEDMGSDVTEFMTHSECFDQVGCLLLRTILKELSVMQHDHIFMSRKVLRINSYLKK